MGRPPLLFVGIGKLKVNGFREVNDLFWTPEAFALLDAKTIGFERQNRRKWLSKSVDVSGVRFHSFTSRKTIHLRCVRRRMEGRLSSSCYLCLVNHLEHKA